MCCAPRSALCCRNPNLNPVFVLVPGACYCAYAYDFLVLVFMLIFIIVFVLMPALVYLLFLCLLLWLCRAEYGDGVLHRAFTIEIFILFVCLCCVSFLVHTASLFY